MGADMRVSHSQKPFKLAIIGYGTVGEGVYWTLQKKSKKIDALLGRSLQIPLVLVKETAKDRNIKKETIVTNHFEDVLNEEHLDVVIEAAPDAETAYPYVSQLLKKGISIITANKELMAKHGEELHSIAVLNHCDLLFEAAVAGGIPLLNTIRHTLKTNCIERFEGILNGTSNFILTKMREEAATFSDALQEAQGKGYAEAVPDKDVDGWDAYFKTMILSHWIYGRSAQWKEEPVGIRKVSVEDMTLAEHINGRIKHVAVLEKCGELIQAFVRPSLVFEDHPLYGVNGVNNGIRIDGSIVGSIMLQGPGAGKYPTASAIVEDLVNLLTNKHEKAPRDRVEFITEGFLEEQQRQTVNDMDSYDGELWFLTGEEGLEKNLETAGIDILQAPVRANGKFAVVVYANERKLATLKKTVSFQLQIYPVLTEKKKLISSTIPLTHVKTASF